MSREFEEWNKRYKGEMAEGQVSGGQGGGSGGNNNGSNVRKKLATTTIATTTTTKESFHTSKKDYNITKGQVFPLPQTTANTRKVKLIQLD